MTTTNTTHKTVPHRIESLAELSVGDEIVFERRSLDDDQIESKRPLRVIDGATRTYANDHHDPAVGCEAFEVEQHAVEVRGEWQGAVTTTLADAINSLDGSHAGIVDYDSGVMVEVARVGLADETDAQRELTA